jgi:hypothetical protein
MKNFNGFKILILLIILFSFLGCCFILAAEQDQGKSLEIVYPKSPFSGIEISGTKTPLPVFIKYFFEYSVFFILCISILLLVFAGFKYITSLGNPAAVKDAKERIESAILGIAVVVFAFLILNTIDPDLLKSRFVIPKINLSTEKPKITEMKSTANFKQIPVSYLILNRFLGVENYIPNKEKMGKIKNIEQLDIKLQKINNDRFEQNRLDNIYNEGGLDITGKKHLFIADSEEKYQGVAVYTKTIAQKIAEKTNQLKVLLNECTCEGGQDKPCTSPLQYQTPASTSGWWMDNGACEYFPCGTNECKCKSSFPCKSYCQCYGEPCPNRKEIRQLETDLELLTEAFEAYVSDGQWVADWIKENNDCFEKNECKIFKQTEDCFTLKTEKGETKKCYIWPESKYGISEEIKKLIYQIAKTEQVYGGLGEVIEDLKKQRDQILEARDGVYYGSRFYLEETSMGGFWTEPFYQFWKAGLEENDKLLKMEHENWVESKSDLMKLDEKTSVKTEEKNNAETGPEANSEKTERMTNQKFCEEELKGSWRIIAEGIEPKELSIRAICNFSQEFSAARYSADPLNEWVIFYKDNNTIQGKQKDDEFLSELIPIAKAIDFGCVQRQSIKIPVGGGINNSLEMIEKMLDSLDDEKPAKINIKEITQYIWAKKQLPEIKNQIGVLEGFINRQRSIAANMEAAAAARKAKDAAWLARGGGNVCLCDIDYFEGVWRFNEAIEKSREQRDLNKLKEKEKLFKSQIQEFEKISVQKYDFNDLDLKEIAEYVISDAKDVINDIDNIKGSNCDIRFSKDTVGAKCCFKMCPSCTPCKGGGCPPCREYERSEEISFLNKLFGFLKINSVSAVSCESNCPPTCATANCQCGCSETTPCPFCKSCRSGFCEACSGEPFPKLLLPTIELLSLYSDSQNEGIKLYKDFPKLTFDYYINELNNLINEPQEWETGPATYVEKINSDLKKSAQNFASAKYCNSFPSIGSKEYEEWQSGTYQIPVLIDKNMAATTYGINSELWDKLVGYEYDFYCCLPYTLK